MKKHLLTLLIICLSFQVFSWGKTGHRIVGLIAEQHLTKKAKKNVTEVLGNETLAEVSTFMDFIRSNDNYDFMEAWHYATIPDGQTYEQAGTPEEGDAIVTINRFIEELKNKDFEYEDEAFVLKCLVHLVGDIHQPLHVGNGNDEGGNKTKVSYFWKNTNLHSVWDYKIIDGQEYSYTEYTDWINHPSSEQVSEWQQDTVLEWAYESMSYRDQVYEMPEDNKLSYEYDYKNIGLINQRLLQAGLRLAGLLNEIYG